jgi:hypothetical protein
MHRRKIISRIEFAKIIEPYRWAPVKLLREQYPKVFENIPEEKIAMIAASGDFVEPITELIQKRSISGVVGGIDVVRWDNNDVKIGYPFNKDHYIILRSDSDDILVIEGPFKDGEHWLERLPERLENARVLEFNE